MFWLCAYLMIGSIIGAGFLWMLFGTDLDDSARDKRINDVRIMITNIPNHLQLGVSFLLAIGILVLIITWLPLFIWLELRRLNKKN